MEYECADVTMCAAATRQFSENTASQASVSTTENIHSAYGYKTVTYRKKKLRYR